LKESSEQLVHQLNELSRKLPLEGIQAIVLTTVCPQPTLWDAILPEQCLSLPAGLAEIDELLDDPRFFEPFRPFFDPRRGRPSIPMEWFLRLMFLRFRYKLGFEALCREVCDSLAWRRFCRIPLGVDVPHPSTLEKIVTRCGEQVVAELNDALLAKANENKVIKTDKVRADTTVVPANVAYPTDSGLMSKGVVKMVAAIARLKAMGLATRTTVRDRSRSMRRRAHDIGAWLRKRTDDAKAEVYAVNAEMADIADAAVADARAVARNARRALAGAGAHASAKAVALVAELERPRRSSNGSPPKPGSASRATPRTGRLGSCRCMTPTPDRSVRAGSASRWSSGSKPRSPTTSTE
jgi:IS5 family transposase